MILLDTLEPDRDLRAALKAPPPATAETSLDLPVRYFKWVFGPDVFSRRVNISRFSFIFLSSFSSYLVRVGCTKVDCCLMVCCILAFKVIGFLLSPAVNPIALALCAMLWCCKDDPPFEVPIGPMKVGPTCGCCKDVPSLNGTSVLRLKLDSGWLIGFKGWSLVPVG